MGSPSRPVVYLTYDDVLEINRQMVLTFGGIYFEGDQNVANPGSLRYVLQAVRNRLFDRELFPGLEQKAAAYAWYMIKGHTFHDGTKRTAMEACRNFLELNGHKLIMDDEARRLALQIDACCAELRDVVDWISRKRSGA